MSPQKRENRDQKMSFIGPLKLKIVLKDKSGSDLPRHKISSFSKITLSKIYRSILEDNLSPQAWSIPQPLTETNLNKILLPHL